MISIGVPNGSAWSEEAQAATRRVPLRESSSRASRDSLLETFSFTSKREPIAIAADALEFDYRGRLLTYKGGVEVTQGDMKLQSETLQVRLGDQANQIEAIVADGNVRLSKGSRWATGGRAVFDQPQQTVVLSQNAVVHDGANQVSGDRVVVYLNEERSVVEGGNGRVKALLFPASGTPGISGGEQ